MDRRKLTFDQELLARPFRRAVVLAVALTTVLICGRGLAVDLTFNINLIAESNPFPPASGGNFSYADVWSEDEYVYVGSDRGFPTPSHISNGPQGISVFRLSSAGVPTYLPPPPPPWPAPPAGFVATTYYGNEMEDVEVWDGIGYFGSDVNGATGRTGVDIVNLAIPAEPLLISRIDTSDCLAGSPSACAHGKVHTLSIQRFNPDTPSEQRFLYTSDNETSIVKISDVTNPSDPQLITSLNLGLASAIDSHEVIVRNNRLYVASKDPGKTSEGAGSGYFHIYDVTIPASPILLKGFQSGTSVHTAMPTDDGKYLIVAEERSDGKVKIYDISNINSPNDPDTPVLKATLSQANVCHNGSCITAHSPHHVHVHGNLAFITWYEAGLQVFNISNPSSPVLVGAFDTWPGTSSNFNGNWGVDLSQGLTRVLISDRKRGLLVLDASGVVLPGDYNQDMVVNEADYEMWRSSLSAKRTAAHDTALADGNYDGIVDAADYVIWREHLGQTGPAGSGAGWVSFTLTVPEPSAILLIAFGIGLMATPRRMRK